MAKITQRERVLLGYDPDSPRSLESDRSPELDFSDVFGGPPRRFSIQESRNVSVDFPDGDTFRRSFLGFGEKPVFGNEVASRRKMHPSNDFFDDIFKIDESSTSCSQSPRIMPAMDSVSSGPGSRVMSPSPLPPSADPILSPAEFSLPMRVTSSDFVATSSAPQSWNSLLSYSSIFNQTAQTQDIVHGDARSSYRPSPLSHQDSVDSNGSPKVTKMQDIQSNVKDPKHPAVVLDSSQFHFSIYKWAGKGVPLVMPLRRRDRSRSKENFKVGSCLSDAERGGRDTFLAGNQKVDTPADQSLTFNSCNSTLVYSKSADSQTHDDIAQELSRSASNTSGLQSTEQQLQESVDFQDPKEFHSFSEKGSFPQGESKVNDPKTPEKTRKFNLRTLGAIFQDQKKDETMVAEKGAKERKVKQKEKPSLDDFVPSRKVNKVKADSFREANDLPKKGQTAAGSKEKDFVKIFNQDGFPNAAKNIQGQSQSQRWADTNRTFKVDNEIKPTTENYDEEQATTINWETTLAEDSEMVDGDSFLFSKPQSDISGTGAASANPVPAMANDPTSKQMNDFAPNIKTIPTLNIKTAAQADILTENSIQEIGKQVQVENKDEMKSYENKIRQWSKGKEGNIRALLSTLQYILWPNSGWKPVPLMEIIEANAVKRAYQKALLRLHPDKLQQKGAAALEKFISEKVFDVLQEAWDQFNSLGGL